MARSKQGFPASTLTLGLAVLAVQALLVDFGGGSHDFAAVLWAFPIALCAGLFAGLRLLRSGRLRGAGWVLWVPTAGVSWILVVQFGSLAPELGLAPTLAWFTAFGLVPVVFHLYREGASPVLFLALLAPPALHGIGEALPLLGMRRAHVSGVVDLNILADRLLVVLLFTIAGLEWLRDRYRPPRHRVVVGVLCGTLFALFVGLMIQQALTSRFVVLVSVPLLLGVALSLRATSRWFWAPFAMAGLFVAGYYFPELAWMGPPEGAVSAFEMAEFDRAGSARAALWSAAIALLAEVPAAGTGLASFKVLYPPYRSAGDQTLGALVHNDWLQLPLEAGFPFLMAVVGVVVLAALAGVRELLGPRPTVPSRERPFFVASLGTIVLMVLHALINFPFYDPVLLNLFVASAVVVVGSIDRAPPVDPEVSARKGRPSRLVLGATLGVSALTVLFWLRAAVYGLALVTLAERAPFPGVPPLQIDGEQRLAWADRLAPTGLAFGMPFYVQAATYAELLRQGVLAREEPMLEVTRTRFESAILGSPWVTEQYVQFSRFLRDLGAPFDERIAPIEEALRRDPFAPRAWLAYAFNLQIEDRWESQAAEVGATWLPRCVYAARTDWMAAYDLLALLPGEVKAAHAEETGRCAWWLIQLGAPLPPLPASVTIPERPR